MTLLTASQQLHSLFDEGSSRPTAHSEAHKELLFRLAQLELMGQWLQVLHMPTQWGQIAGGHTCTCAAATATATFSRPRPMSVKTGLQLKVGSVVWRCDGRSNGRWQSAGTESGKVNTAMWGRGGRGDADASTCPACCNSATQVPDGHLRNQGWLLMSLMPPARQPYRLLKSTCANIHQQTEAGPGALMLLMQHPSSKSLQPSKHAIHNNDFTTPNLIIPPGLACSSLRMRSRTVTEKWDGKARAPLRIFL